MLFGPGPVFFQLLKSSSNESIVQTKALTTHRMQDILEAELINPRFFARRMIPIRVPLMGIEKARAQRVVRRHRQEWLSRAWGLRERGRSQQSRPLPESPTPVARWRTRKVSSTNQTPRIIATRRFGHRRGPAKISPATIRGTMTWSASWWMTCSCPEQRQERSRGRERLVHPERSVITGLLN